MNANVESRFDQGVDLGVCLRRLRSWPAPPNWSFIDWREEAERVVTTAAWIAGAEYSNERGIPLAAFACCRVRAALQRRYREEWGYAKHMCPYSTADDGGREPCAALPTGAAGLDMLDLCAKVKEAVADLPVDLRNLIEQLFWEGRSQWEVSRKLGICQTAVSKRKRIALKLLRQNPVLREAA